MEPKIVFVAGMYTLIYCWCAFTDILAAKKIKAREELLLSYGEDYWKKENSEDEGSNPDV